MKNCLTVVSAMVVAASFCFAAEENGGAESVDKAWNKAILANDLDAVVACYAADAVAWLPDEAPAKGKEAIRQAYTQMLRDNTITAANLVNTHYKTCGDLAVAWGEFTLTMSPKAGGNPVTMTGRYSEVAKRENGRWVYAVDHASANPTPKS